MAANVAERIRDGYEHTLGRGVNVVLGDVRPNRFHHDSRVLELPVAGRENRRGDPAQETEHDASEKRSGDQESYMHGRLLLDDIQIGILREISTAASFEASGGIWARAAHQLRTNGRLIGQ